MTSPISTETDSDEERTTATGTQPKPSCPRHHRRRGILATAGAALASLAGCSALTSGDPQEPAETATDSPTPPATDSSTSPPTRTKTTTPTETETPTPTAPPAIDEQFAIAADSLRAAVEELQVMNLIRDDVPAERAYEHPDRRYGVRADQVARTVPEDVVAFDPTVVLDRVERAERAIDQAESLAEAPGEEFQLRVDVYRQTIEMFRSAGKAYKAMQASALLFWDGLEQYQAGEYEAGYSTLITAHNAVRGKADEEDGISDPDRSISRFYSTMDDLLTGDVHNGFNDEDQFILDDDWLVQVAGALGVIHGEWMRIFSGSRRIAKMRHRYAEMRRAYANDDWDRVQFHTRAISRTPRSLKTVFADDPELRLPNVLDAYDAPGLCIGQETADPVAQLNRAADEQRGDILEDGMEAFETAIENCPPFPEPPSNR